MAIRNKRMFSHDIVRSDEFLAMPVSSRELYFQMGMDIDDRGYVANVQGIMRLTGATQNDLDILIAKRFILKRKDGLYLQKHFGINNIIRPDRFQETKYIDDLSTLRLEENGAYTDNQNKGIPVIKKEDGTPMVYQATTTRYTEVKSLEVNPKEGNKDSSLTLSSVLIGERVKGARTFTDEQLKLELQVENLKRKEKNLPVISLEDLKKQLSERTQ